MPRVSVVIPAYNAERFIAAAIESVLAQTFTDCEVIVADDGSRDRTGEVVRAYGTRVCYLAQPNSGAAAARNLGLAHATGEWIAFLDADDQWLPEKLAIQLTYAQQNPQAAFIYCDMIAVDDAGNIRTVDMLHKERHEKLRRRDSPWLWPRRRRPELLELAFSGLPFPYPSTVLVRADTLREAGGFDPAFQRNYHEDFDAFARVARIAPPHFIPQSLIRYRLPQPPADRRLRQQNWGLLLHKLEKLWAEEPDKVAAVRWLLGSHYSKLARQALIDNNPREARRLLRIAFGYRQHCLSDCRRFALACIPGLRDLYRVLQIRRRRAKLARG